MSELKPCPLCNGSAVYKTKNAIDDFLGTQTVSCRECCTSAPLHNWNNRPNQDQLVKEVAELKILNERLKQKDANKYILLTKREFELMGQEVSSSYSQAGCMDYESALCANAAHTAYRRAETRNASKLYPPGDE